MAEQKNTTEDYRGSSPAIEPTGQAANDLPHYSLFKAIALGGAGGATAGAIAANVAIHVVSKPTLKQDFALISKVVLGGTLVGGAVSAALWALTGEGDPKTVARREANSRERTAQAAAQADALWAEWETKRRASTSQDEKTSPSR